MCLQEFFERQKFASARSLLARTPGQKKRGLSQDLIALHTVSRVHSNFPSGSCKQKPIKRVDLEKFHSCTRQINEVDMGPCSPSQTPSKLLLSDGKLDKGSGCPVSYRNADQTLSQDFLKPDDVLKDKTYRECTEKPGQKEQIIQEKGLSENSTVENPVESVLLRQQKEFPFSEPKPVGSFKNNCRIANLGYDPFASEDFQVTPLVRYSKKRSPDDTGVVKHKKRKHSGESKSWVKEIQDSHIAHSSKHLFTSTPVTEIHRKQGLVADAYSFGGISPIFRATAFSKDVDNDFKFSPHSMFKVPSIKDNDNEGESTVNKIQGKVKQKSGKEKTNSSASYRTDGQTIQSFKHLIDKDNSPFYNDEYLKTCSSKEYEISRNWVISPYFRYSSCKSGPDSGTALSSDDRCESSVGRDSLLSESDQGHAGSLSKYKRSIREKVIERSPLQVNDSHSFKNSVKDQEEIQISKPNFKDIDEDFQYTPVKAKVYSQSEIMNMYRMRGTSSQVQINSAGGEDLIFDAAQRNDRHRLSGGSVEEVPSPVPADEFPKHLLSPPDQLQKEIDRTLAQIVTDERESKIVDQDREESARCYRPLKYHMEDVLDEMKKLEEQDTPGTPVYCDGKDRKDNPQSPQGDVATESFEADASLETEGLFMNSDGEYIQMVEENCSEQTSGTSNCEKDLIIKDKNYMEKPDSVKKVNNPETQQLDENKKMEKDLTNETDMDIKVKASCASVAECVVTNKPAENSKANFSALKEHDTLKSSDMKEKEVFDVIEGDLYSCTTEKFDNCNVEGKSIKANGNIHNKHDLLHLSWKKGAGRNENCTGKSYILDNIVNNVELVVKTGKIEANTAVLPEQLQVPEISSGKNKLTQTDVSWSLKKSFVDESTSPFQELNYIQVTDIGIQCDLGTFPTLADLARKSFKVKSAINTASLYKNTETYRIPHTADASKENMDPTKSSTTNTFEN